MELLKNDASLMAFGKDQIETLAQGLKFLVAFIDMQLENRKDFKFIVVRFEAAARRVTSLYYSFLIEQMTDEMIEQRIISFSYLLDKMETYQGRAEGDVAQISKV